MPWQNKTINEKRAYTEYTVTQPTTDFAIGFDDFDEGSKDIILVTLNGVLVETLGYAAIRKNDSTVTITPAITEGTVRLTRETDIDAPLHKFTAGALFSAKSMDENFQQVRHSQQEVRDGFVFLEYNTNGIVQASKEATIQAKEATIQATASAVRAESASDAAVQAVGSLQGVVNAATTATTNANTAIATANTAASQATAATTSAQNATQAANTAKQEAAAAAANANAVTVDTLAATGRANEAADIVADLVVGKVRAQDVSTADDSTQAAKNIEFRNELDALPFEEGLLPSTKTTYLSSAVGAVMRSAYDKLNDTLSVKDFGAKGDGVTDDTGALRAAIMSGTSLHWGNNTDTYLITETINHIATSNIFWQSNGANVLFKPDVAKTAIISIELDGNDMMVANNINFDGTKKAVTGLRVKNSAVKAANLAINDIFITRCHRATQAIEGGSGIEISGLLNVVSLSKPRIVDISMAAGAGVTSSQGISGITITRSAGKDAKAISITQPYIEEIYSEDLDYFDDQDGIVVFTDYMKNEVTPNTSDCVIEGGVYKNCLGRSIKFQSEFGKVTNPHFVRTRGFTRGFGNHEVDFQVGGGIVTNMTFNYNGSRPDTLVMSSHSSGSNVANSVGLTSVHSVKGSITNQAVPFYYFFTTIAGSAYNANISISGIDIKGDITSDAGDLLLLTGNSDYKTVNIRDVSAAFNNSVVNYGGTNLVTVNLTDIANTRSTECAAVYASLDPATVNLSAFNLTNIKDARGAFSGQQPLNATRLDTVLPKNATDNSGVVKFKSFVLQPSSTTKLGTYGYSKNNVMLFVSIAYDSTQTQVVLAAQSNGIVVLLPVASTIVTAGGTTKPSDGVFRFYYVDDEFAVENNDTSARVLTMMVIG